MRNKVLLVTGGSGEIGAATAIKVKVVQECVNFLSGRIKKEIIKTKGKKTVAFKSWPMGVKGKLSRREMYDCL